MTRRFLVRLPCMERRPAEAAVRFAWGAPERRNPVAAGASDRIGMRFAFHRGGDRECIIDRKSVVWGKGVAVRVDSGVRRIIKQKKRNNTQYELEINFIHI